MVEAIYIHIPFCKLKCRYCDFISYAEMERFYAPYVEALINEIRKAPPQGAISSIYLGGGTPTVLSWQQLGEILAAARGHFEVSGQAEITLETNPGTVDENDLERLCEAGYNRISLGVQALDDTQLKKLGRIHSKREARKVYEWARAAGFGNISIDLMYGLEGQSPAWWRRTLEEALGWGAEHISLYELSVEEGTPLARAIESGEVELPEEEARLEMYETAIETLKGAGYEHYEISNFARPGFRAKHNRVYWRNEEYFGFGAGATRYLAGERCSLTSSVEEYIERIARGEDTAESCEKLSRRARMGETIMLALRTAEGMEAERFEEIFGVALGEAYGELIEELSAREWIVQDEKGLRLTRAGLLWSNRVFQEFLEIEG